MSKTIQTKDASIKTAAVEIKSLTVSGKQVTLSVFRQVERERLIDLETAQLNGMPWGRINYYWKDNEVGIHVLWQKGEELRRSLVSEFYANSSYHQRRAELYGLYKTSSNRLAAFLCAKSNPAELNIPSYIYDDFVLEFPGENITVSKGHKFFDVFAQNRHWRTSVSSRAKTALEKEGTALDEHTEAKLREHRLAMIEEDRLVLNRLNEVEALYKQRYTEILDLPQLFIAV